ncbi:MAG: hypothetical protein LBH85_01450 [Treponema sp.]|jgi:hypothetical protein|nr:hypothetical protein [Treponema sp.]
MIVIMADGRGYPKDPAGEYAAALVILFGLPYTTRVASGLWSIVPSLNVLWTL